MFSLKDAFLVGNTQQYKYVVSKFRWEIIDRCPNLHTYITCN